MSHPAPFQPATDAADTSQGAAHWLVQYELDGQWHTCAKRGSFIAACAKARAEGRAMKWAHMTSVIRPGDPEALRRTAENNFRL